MKVFIPTCNAFLYLLPMYMKFFSKYWPEQEATFLGFARPDNIEFKEGFSFVSLGNQDDFGRVWTDPLRPFIESLDDPYFVMMLEDFFIAKKVDVAKVIRLENELKQNGVAKAMLDNHMSKVHGVSTGTGFVIIRQTADYRLSTHPAIWRKDYFLSYLKPSYTAWDFEIKNMNESKSDGAKIVAGDGTWEESAVFTANIIIQGRFTDRGGLLEMSKEDILFITEEMATHGKKL